MRWRKFAEIEKKGGGGKQRSEFACNLEGSSDYTGTQIKMKAFSGDTVSFNGSFFNALNVLKRT